MASTSPARERIVEAANDLFVTHGIRATSLESVADVAGCSRMTVYRHFPGKPTLIREVVMRQVLEQSADFDAMWDADATLEGRLTAAFAWGVETCRNNPLFMRMTETEPETLLPALTFDGESILELASGLVALRLRDADIDEDVAPTLSELLCRLVLSVVLQPYGRLRLESHDELEEFARTWITPAVRMAGRTRRPAADGT